MKGSRFLIIIGVILMLLPVSILWNRGEGIMLCDKAVAGQDFVVRAGLVGELIPLEQEFPSDLGCDELALVSRTPQFGAQMYKHLRPCHTLRLPSFKRLHFGYMAQIIQQRVELKLFAHHVNDCIGRSYPIPLYTFAIRHIII